MGPALHPHAGEGQLPASSPVVYTGRTTTLFEGFRLLPRASTQREGRPPGPHLPAGALVAGRYRIAAPLGRGGMGEVYRAQDLKLEQSVALKFLALERAADPAERTLLCREVRLARGIAHPNVCRVFDLGEADGRSFLSMEHIEGEDLESLLTRRGRLPVREARAIARQLAAGLAAIHDGGLVHCDIKPANVMIDRRGRARIIDFGVAVQAGEPGRGRRGGTLGYMAPEQLSRREVSARTDLYSLGLVLDRMVSGPSGGPPAAGLPARRGKGVDTRTRALLAHCLAPDPSRRPASAGEVAAALA